MLNLIREISPASHVYELEFNKDDKSQEFLLVSDLHWDNPKCDRGLLKEHFDEAKHRGAKIIVNGDFFCLMQGKGDRRGSKGDLRPEHKTNNYLDSVINTALEWFEPYKDTLVQICTGNHEQSIVKYQETDVLRRFVDLYNHIYRPDIPLVKGSYRGWITLSIKAYGKQRSCKLHYFHGSGGGGPVTKNMIQHQRQDAIIEGADVIWLGHVHELYHNVIMKYYLKHNFESDIREVHHLQTATYKEESVPGKGSGWHVERGAPPKPLGGYWMRLKFDTVNAKYKLKFELT